MQWHEEFYFLVVKALYYFTQHSNIKFISSHHCVISLYLMLKLEKSWRHYCSYATPLIIDHIMLKLQLISKCNNVTLFISLILTIIVVLTCYCINEQNGDAWLVAVGLSPNSNQVRVQVLVQYSPVTEDLPLGMYWFKWALACCTYRWLDEWMDRSIC